MEQRRNTMKKPLPLYPAEKDSNSYYLINKNNDNEDENINLFFKYIKRNGDFETLNIFELKDYLKNDKYVKNLFDLFCEIRNIK